ncbi:LysR family transcriptional regulator [Rhizobium sp. TH135]|uniref:LysR family transcriptional regulator n=1 Tax=Rhizobium sp. TH135 TaxID=2067451 RepID=UPI000C7DD0E1|nr:LysR family transcriptional regulator [Rhizobium sp. TH135]PLK73138.1 LysR family transcriptional regulator [Rhizobium sp. TH135]
MRPENFNDILAFVMVAREESFTRAAIKLGVSQSALSQTVRALEARLGLRLLTRTTRRVSPTAAGERLLASAAPRFDEIQSELVALSEMRDRPAGTVRITTGEHAAITILAPALEKILPDYPEVKVEVTVDYGLTDIVADRYDAGVRLGEQIAKDMIAIKIGPEMRMAVVGAPSYFQGHPRPTTPEDLTRHNCIQMRMPTYGNMQSWEFEKEGHEVKVRVDGQIIFNNSTMRLDAVKRGLGLTYLPEDLVAESIVRGELVRVLEDWCEPFDGYHLYYPNRRHPSPAFALVVDALRYVERKPR